MSVFALCVPYIRVRFAVLSTHKSAQFVLFVVRYDWSMTDRTQGTEAIRSAHAHGRPNVCRATVRDNSDLRRESN